MMNKDYPLYKLPEVHDLKHLVQRRCNDSPETVAFTYRQGKNRIISKSCKNFWDDVNALGEYMISKYNEKHIAIISGNSYEWLVSFLAIVCSGNIAVLIDKESEKEKMIQLINKSRCCCIIGEEKIITQLSTKTKSDNIYIERINQIIDVGSSLINSGCSQFEDYQINNEQCAAIFFTSGTTGESKGVMLSHKNILHNIHAARQYAKVEGTVLSVLPFHHAFGLIIGVLCVYAYECSVHIVKSLKRITQELKDSKPYAMAVVPLFIETFEKMIIQEAVKSEKLKKLKSGMKISNGLLKIGIDVREKLFKELLDSFGGKLKYLVCGGAPLDRRYIEFFRSIGINVLTGYGITECSPVIAMNRNHYWCDGSVGRVLQNSQVKISNENEILVKGDNVMLGYFADDELTNEVIHDGWFSTGDLGYIDRNGFLFLTGRIKNLIILSGGENISPEELEQKILNLDGVQEAVIYADNSIIVAEIFPEIERMDDFGYFENLIAEFNRSQPSYKQIGKVKLRTNEFPKNSSRKIIRSKIN